MADPTLGLIAAVEELHARMGISRAAVPALAAEQLALLPTPAAIADAGADEGAAARSGRGRPPGSRNRSTDQWVEFIAARYRSPLLFLAETFNRPVAQLADELGCKREAAFNLQVRAAEALAPYMHAKQPVAVQLSGDGLVQIVLPDPTAYARAGGLGGGGVTLDQVAMALETGTEENQGVDDVPLPEV